MSGFAAAWAEAVRGIREDALREVQALVERLQPTIGADWDGDQQAYRMGHFHCRVLVCAEIEGMIAIEEEAARTQASDGLEDG